MKKISITLIAIAIIGCLTWLLLSRREQQRFVERIVVDTVEKVLPPKTIYITKVRTKVQYIRDTIVCEKPFVASLDTVALGDTISAKFYFPEKELSLFVHTRADSLRVPILFREKIEQKREWFESPLLFLSGVVLGWLLFRK
jgi:hypothetical protein